MNQSSSMSLLHLLQLLLLVLLSTMPRSIHSFMIPSSTSSFISSSSLTATATPFGEMEKEHQKNANENNNNSNGENSSSNDDDDEDWTPVAGGFLPRLKNHFKSTATKITTPNIVEVSTLQEYKDHVVDSPEEIVVVKFYSTWCRSCKAMAPLYKKLANDLLKETSSRTSRAPRIKFVQVPVTPENAMLHQGLSVPSVPFGHIYHKAVGLVEESSLNKKEFHTFSKLVSQYVKGECDIDAVEDAMTKE